MWILNKVFLRILLPNFDDRHLQNSNSPSWLAVRPRDYHLIKNFHHCFYSHHKSIINNSTLSCKSIIYSDKFIFEISNLAAFKKLPQKYWTHWNSLKQHKHKQDTSFPVNRYRRTETESQLNLCAPKDPIDDYMKLYYIKTACVALRWAVREQYLYTKLTPCIFLWWWAGETQLRY